MDDAKAGLEQAENATVGAHLSTAYVEQFESQDDESSKKFEKKLLRKLDRRFMPTLIIMYLLNFLDRSNLAQARQGSLEEDLKMTGTNFNLATSIFFVGYLLMQLPSNLLLTRVRPSLYLAGSCCLWGVVSTCNAGAQNFTHLVVIRFFLGFVEAPFFPGAVFLMSSWYTRAELTRRISWLYSGNALANMFGGLLGAAILGNLDGGLGIAGWRWLFIIVSLFLPRQSVYGQGSHSSNSTQEGVIAIAFALVAMFLLPDYPHTTRWMNDEEKAFAAWRLLKDINETDEYADKSIWDGVKLALRDYRLYLFVFMQHISLLSQSFQYFFPTIVGTLGYGRIVTLWLTAPVWVCIAPSFNTKAGTNYTLRHHLVCHILTLHLRDLDVGKVQRSIASYHWPHACRCRGQCGCYRDDFHRCQVLRHVPDAHGCCICL